MVTLLHNLDLHVTKRGAASMYARPEPELRRVRALGEAGLRDLPDAIRGLVLERLAGRERYVEAILIRQGLHNVEVLIRNKAPERL
jgi:hypothetical protein